MGSGWLLYTCGSHYGWEQELFISQKYGVFFRASHHYELVVGSGFQKIWQPWAKISMCDCVDLEWKLLPMINGWTKFNDDPKAALKYRKGADGKVVYVEGLIKQPNSLTAANKTIACLPEGYRPKNFWWQTSTPEYKEGSVSLRVNTDGKVFLTSTAAYLQAIVSDSLPVCLTIPI